MYLTCTLLMYIVTYCASNTMLYISCKYKNNIIQYNGELNNINDTTDEYKALHLCQNNHCKTQVEGLFLLCLLSVG